jgi:quaternary ammonium compound-resistance protein SugE
MAWICLFAAGLFEVVWAYFMKESEGFSRLAPSAASIAGMVASVGLLAVAMRTIPLGTAYVVWTGIGAVGTFAVGIAAYGESMSAGRLAAAAIIISGLVMMKLSTPDG